MKNALLTAVLFVAAQTAFAADTATLDFGTFNASYEVELTDGGLVGSQYNLGNGSGEVKLVYNGGAWEGSFGFNQIKTRKITKRSETLTTYEFTVLPGGSYVAHIERKADKTHVTLQLPNSDTARSTLKNGKYLSGDNRYVSVNLNKRDDNTWKGMTTITRGRLIETASTKLVASGALNPEVLASADPALYVILYMLPTNYFR